MSQFIFMTLGYHPDATGGAYRYVQEVAERLAECGHTVHVIYPASGKAPAGSESRRNVRLHRIPNGNGPFWRNWLDENKAVVEAVKTVSAPESIVILCHAFFQRAVAQLQLPFFMLFTGPWSLEYTFSQLARPQGTAKKLLSSLIAKVMHWEERNALTRARRILTLSKYYQHQLPIWHGQKGFPVIDCIGGGVNLEQFKPSPERATLRQQNQLASGDFVFLAVRRLDPRMGLETLIEAFKAHAAKSASSILWLAGQGPSETYLKQLAAEHPRIRFLGFVSDERLVEIYNMADCTVMPSLDLEGYGLVTAESLACGCPVIGSNRGATPELLHPLGPGLVVPAGSASALALKMDEIHQGQLLPDRALCRRYAEENLSWNEVVAALAALPVPREDVD